MFAVVRESAFDPAKLAGAEWRQEEYRRLRAQQPGYRGSLALDAGAGRQVIVQLWETREHWEAAAAVMNPDAARLLGPLRLAPDEPAAWSTTIASGPVRHLDLPRG